MESPNVVPGFLMSIYALVVYKIYLDTFLTEWNRFQNISGWSVFFLWQYFINSGSCFLPPGLNLICTLVAAVIMALVSYKGGYGKSCVFAVLFVAVWMLLEGVVEFGVDILFGGTTEYFLTYAVCSQSLLLLIVSAIRLGINRREKIRTRGIEELFFVILPMAGVILYYALYKMAIGGSQGNSYVGLLWLIVAAMALLLMNLSLYPAYLFALRALHNYKSLTLYKKHIEMFRQEQFLEEAATAEILEFRHDMKQHLVYVRNLIQEGRGEEAIHSVEELIGGTEKMGILKSNTGNIVVDALINHAWIRAVERKIDFQVRLDGLSGIGISNSDLCILLGNALDNALEASEYMPEGQRTIKVEIRYLKNCLLICITNRFIGKLLLKGGRIQSKKEGVGHGIGLLSMEKMAMKLGGTLTIDEKEGVFSLEIWIPCG